MKEEKKIYRRGVAVGVIVGILMVLAIIFVRDFFWIGIGKEETPTSSYAKTKVKNIQALIDEHYLQDVDEEKLSQGMYAGLVAALEDPYSAYFSAEDYELVTQSNTGHYEGIGVTMELNSETGVITVAECVKGGAAEKSGILPGDELLSVDGVDVSTIEFQEISLMIRQEGTDEVKLKVRRNGEELEYVVKKEEIVMETVTSEMLDEHTGYLEISEFKEVTAEQFREAYARLEQQGMEKLIIDLRNNPGGLLSAVCDTLDQILPKGLIVYTEDKNGNREEYKSSGKTPIEIPLVVLVNGESASAAEIFAGAVKDYEIGTLVGTTTFGKGIVQKTFEFPDHSALKITVSHYYTPKGNDIHKKGIEPDVIVENDENSEADLQLEKALEILNE